MDEPPSYSLLNILADQSLLYFIVAAVLIFFAGWTSAMEAAFFAVKADDIERFKSSREPNERIAWSLLKHPRLLLTVLTASKYTLLLAAAIITMASFSWRAVINLDDLSVATGVLILTVLFAMFGVIIPKIYGSSNALRLTVRNGRICARLVKMLNPVVAPILKMAGKVEQILASKKEQNSVQELTHALQLATIDNERVEGEEEILEGIVNFGMLKVRQVMRPRADISFTDISLSFPDLLEFVRKSGYSRVPVCDRSLDKVIGLLYIKDLLPFLDQGAAFDWRKLLRTPYYVHETKKIDSLLKDFQEKRVHIALVRNQAGATSGLITLEDVIEEIIGDINDEFDEIGSRYQRLNENTYIFDGKTSVYEFCKVMGINPDAFTPLKGINESISRVIMDVNESLPLPGERIAIGPVTLIVETVDQKRIKKVRVHVNETTTT